MTHLSEDQLLALALSITSPEEERDMRIHLMSCPSCSDRLRLIERDVEVIASLSPEVHANTLPIARRDSQFSSILRAAATLLIGVAVGSIATMRLMSEPPSVRASSSYNSTSFEAVHTQPAADATAAF